MFLTTSYDLLMCFNTLFTSLTSVYFGPFATIETKDGVTCIAISEKLLKSTKFSILINTRHRSPSGVRILLWPIYSTYKIKNTDKTYMYAFPVVVLYTSMIGLLFVQYYSTYKTLD